jgi:hypothetical protein
MNNDTTITPASPTHVLYHYGMGEFVTIVFVYPNKVETIDGWPADARKSEQEISTRLNWEVITYEYETFLTVQHYNPDCKPFEKPTVYFSEIDYLNND